MNRSAESIIRKQADEHPLEFTGEFESLEDYCVYLMHSRAYEEVARAASGKAVLDLGCNNAYGTDFVGQVASSIVGVDVNLAALADAKRRFPRLDLRPIDGVTLPFPDNQFDVVCSLQVIEHVLETLSYIAEIVRVLKPEGVAYLTTPNAAIRLDPGMMPWNGFHVREYRAEELRRELEAAFPSVTVQGLFACDELYRVELRRCERALERARRPAPEQPAPTLKQEVANLVKLVLPNPVLDGVRRLMSAPQEVAADALDAAILARHSTDDFFYRTADLDRSLDLMAVCRKR